MKKASEPPTQNDTNCAKEGSPPRLKVLGLLMIPCLLISFRNIKVSHVTAGIADWVHDQQNAEVNDAPRMLKVQAPPMQVPSDPFVVPEIEELVKYNFSCPGGLSPIENTHYPTSVTHPPGRKVPKVIHITSRHRCATESVIRNIKKWRFDNYSVYFHDDQAIEQLFTHPFTRKNFPTLREGLKCVTNGATKSDLWRYLVLSIYGGVYTDIDNSPVKFNGNTIQPTDDSFFVVEGLGVLSQFFMASSVGHPLMKKMLDTGVERLKNIRNVMDNSPATTTGPGACKMGFVRFMADGGVKTGGYVKAGIYIGTANRSVTVVGERERSKDYVNRMGLSYSKKMQYYKALGITHFHDARKAKRRESISCMMHLERTKGTDKVANYKFVKDLKVYIEVNKTSRGTYNLTF